MRVAGLTVIFSDSLRGTRYCCLMDRQKFFGGLGRYRSMPKKLSCLMKTSSFYFSVENRSDGAGER